MYNVIFTLMHLFFHLAPKGAKNEQIGLF